MRPTPRTRHLLAVLIFAGISATAGYLAAIDTRVSKTQIHIASVAIKRAQPELFANDPVFGESGRWRFHTPFFQSLMEVILVPTDYQDLTLPFRALTGVVVMLYLCGMYALLYRQCRSWSISAFVAVLSSSITYTLGRSFWGVGSLGSIDPPTLVLAMIPLIVLSYLHYERQWRVLLVFAFVGLCGNLHMVTAMNLAIVLLIVFLGRRKFSPSAWPMALAGLLCAVAGAIPYMGYYLHLRYGSVPAGAQIDTASVYEAFRLGNLAILYPDMLKSMLYWLLMALVLLIPAVAVLSRIERFRVRELSVWVWLALGVLFVSLGLHGVSQLAGIMRDKAPPFVDFARGSNLIMLPIYVLFAQALTNLFRLVRTHRAALRWACAAFMAVWMLPTDNCRVIRHLGYDLATSFMAEDEKPPRVQELHARQRRKAELRAIAQWASQNTDPGAVFMIGRGEFRMLSRRAIIASSDDVNYYYYVTPWALKDWVTRMHRQQEAMQQPNGRADEQKIALFVQDLAREDYRQVSEWYVVLSTRAVPENPTVLEPITGSGWGKDYQLFRIRVIAGSESL